MSRTHGQLACGDYLVLADPEKIFSFQQVAPVIRMSLLTMMPPVFATTLNELAGLLSTNVMIALNKTVELDHRNPGTVAGTFLAGNGLLA